MWKPSRTSALRGAALLLAALALPALTSPTAQAASWDHQLHTNDGDPGGRLRFRAYGDVVEICDIEADGWAVDVEVWNPDGMTVRDTFRVGGNGNCKTHRASNGHDLKEGAQYHFTLNLYKSPGIYRYEDRASWVA